MVNGANADNSRGLSSLLSTLREDLTANKGHWERAGFHALAVYRLGVWANTQKGRLSGLLANIVYRLLYGLIRNVYSIELPRGTKVGKRLWMPHHAGIVITDQAEIGDDCLILQNVTIGLGGLGGRKRRGPHAPRIGNGVEIGAGAVVMGGISIGDGARIGPNAVVWTDVPAGGTALATPTKIMKSLRTRPNTEAEEPADTRVD